LKRNIFIVVDGLSPGGAERQCLLLAQNLNKNWNPFLIAINDGVLAKKYESFDIPVFFISRTNRIDFINPIIKLLKLVRKYKPALLHSWGWMSAYASEIVSIVTKTPQINGMVRSASIPMRTKKFVKFAVKLGKFSVANSKAGLLAWKVPKSKGTIIYNGFDWKRVDFQHKLSSELTKVIMTASMSDKKDWHSFISVAELMCNQDNSIIFTGFGDGINRSKILYSATNLIKLKKLSLPGRIDDPVAECLNSDIGILLSSDIHGEGISNSIMEYMACELPVICTNSGGNPELVVDGVTGFLIYPKNNPDEIAEKITWLKNNPDKAKQMGIAGRKRILSDFSTKKMVQRYEKLYDRVLS